MFWPFNHFTKSPGANGTIGTLYGMIVAQARDPQFYGALGVRDTVDGRFDLLILHLWMVLRRLGKVQVRKGLQQGLFDHFCSDMDANLREMGVGDLTVPKRMQAFGEAFYGRSAAYDVALSAGHDALVQALGKNLLNGQRPDLADRLAHYVEASIACLSAPDEAAFVNGQWKFAPLVQPAEARG